MRALLGTALVAGVFTWSVYAYVWFGYRTGCELYEITPGSVALETPAQHVQLHLTATMTDIGETIDVTDRAMFWTENPDWVVSPAGTLECRASGSGTVHARLDDGQVFTRTIEVDSHLPPRILMPPVAPLSPAPSPNVVHMDKTTRFVYAPVNGGQTSIWLSVSDQASPEWRCTVLAQLRLLGTLQGLVNRQQPRIYLSDDEFLCEDVWWPHVLSNGFYCSEDVRLGYYLHEGTVDPPPTNTFHTIMGVVTQFLSSSCIDGLVLYPTNLFTDVYNAHLLNYITAFCAVSNCLAMSFDQYAVATNAAYQLQLPVLLNVTPQWWAAAGMTNGGAVYRRMIDELWPRCSRRLLANWHPHTFFDGIDYLVAHKIMPVRWQDKSCTPSEMRDVLDPLLDQLYLHGGIIGDWGTHIEMFEAVVDGQRLQVPLAEAHYYGLTLTIKQGPNYRTLTTSETTKPCGTFDLSVSPSGQRIYQPHLEEGETVESYTWSFADEPPATNYVRFPEQEICYLGMQGLTIQYTLSAENFSFHSGLRFTDLAVHPVPPTPVTFETNKIYTTFLWSDGDNIEWDAHHWPNVLNKANANAHAFGAGFGINPLLCELAPLMVKGLIEMAPTNIEPMWASGGIGMTESETYGADYGVYADEMLREYYRMGKVYADHAGISTINPQLITAYRGCDVATEVYTNALMITPGNGGTYLTRVYPPEGVQSVIAGRTWVSNGVVCIAPIQAAYSTNQLAEVFEGDGIRQMAMAPTNHVFEWTARPQFLAIGILGNLVFPGADAADAYYQYIGTEKLHWLNWLLSRGLIANGNTNIVTVSPQCLGNFYRNSNGD